jgi:hypothetical protein
MTDREKPKPDFNRNCISCGQAMKVDELGVSVVNFAGQIRAICLSCLAREIHNRGAQ